MLIPVLNEEGHLPDCLASCAFADEVVVLDSGSRDRTTDVARERGARVIHREFDGYATQKNWGLAKVTHDWVLILDADERVPEKLRCEIEEVLRSDSPRAGYWLRRRSEFLGRDIRGCGWQSDRVLRLFDRRLGSYEERRIHEEVSLRGSAGTLQTALEHHPCRDLGAWLMKIEGYSAKGAEELAARGVRGRIHDIVLRPPARFMKQYFFRMGFRDGTQGLILCALSAYGVFQKYARLWEATRSRQ